MPEDFDGAAWARAARGGLCAVCRHAALVPTPSATLYLRCRHPSLPKYPPMPVVRCAAFRARAEEPEETEETEEA